MKKSDNISVELNDLELREKGITLFARLEKRRPNKANEYPIKLRIIYKGGYRDYSTKQKASLEEWKKIVAPMPKDIAANKKIKIIAVLNRAYKIITEIDSFNFSEFKDIYLDKKNNDRYNVFNWYDDKIKELKDNEQLGTAGTYEYSMRALKKFSKKEVLQFNDITVAFLKKFEKYIENDTTTGIYLRPLKHIFNRANKITSFYPFEKGGYKIPTPRNNKKALIKEELKRIYFYESAQGGPERFYKDIWLFSYFANGMNMKDICLLKYSDIKGYHIEFRRAKTIHSNKSSKPILIDLTDDLQRIIKEHGTNSKNKKDYIFPFLKSGMDAEKQMKTIKQATKQTNKYIKRVAKILEIEAEVSTYTARHSFATILKNAGVAPSFIGESLGHSSLKTTESYLGSFETAQRKENINKLKDW